MKESTSSRLKQLLADRNLKQIDVLDLALPYSKKYGVKLTKSDLSQYISNKVTPRQDKLTILGLALDVSEAWLMGYDVPMERPTQLNKPPVDKQASSEIILKEHEVILIQKYRLLDQRGQEAVDNVLEHEYRAAVEKDTVFSKKQA
mgnify:CR=1 FL=1